MTNAEFLKELQEMLQLDDPLAADTQLQELEEWDSLAYMVLIAFFDKKFGQRITFQDLNSCLSPEDLIRLAKGAIA